MSIETKNAIIRSATLSTADHGCLSGWLHLDYNGAGQGFGGFSLYSPRSPSAKHNYAGVWIWRCLEIAGVTDWDKLPGKTIRVQADHSCVYAIGHIVKNIWFEPRVEFKAMEDELAA